MASNHDYLPAITKASWQNIATYSADELIELPMPLRNAYEFQVGGVIFPNGTITVTVEEAQKMLKESFGVCKGCDHLITASAGIVVSNNDTWHHWCFEHPRLTVTKGALIETPEVNWLAIQDFQKDPGNENKLILVRKPCMSPYYPIELSIPVWQLIIGKLTLMTVGDALRFLKDHKVCNHCDHPIEGPYAETAVCDELQWYEVDLPQNIQSPFNYYHTWCGRARKDLIKSLSKPDIVMPSDPCIKQVHWNNSILTGSLPNTLVSLPKPLYWPKEYEKVEFGEPLMMTVDLAMRLLAKYPSLHT